MFIFLLKLIKYFSFLMSLGKLLYIDAPWKAKVFLPDSHLTFGSTRRDPFPRVFLPWSNFVNMFFSDSVQIPLIDLKTSIEIRFFRVCSRLFQFRDMSLSLATILWALSCIDCNFRRATRNFTGQGSKPEKGHAPDYFSWESIFKLRNRRQKSRDISSTFASVKHTNQ